MRANEFRQLKKGQRVYMGDEEVIINNAGRFLNPVTNKLEYGIMLHGDPINIHRFKDISLTKVRKLIPINKYHGKVNQ